MNKIYTAGYSGHTPEQLKQAVEALNAVVLDIRHARRSRMWQWNEDNLFRVLGVERYRILPEWGNVNFKTGPIQLADSARGLLKALKVLDDHSIILLCGCREYSDCHRRTCAELFHERGQETQELEWPDKPIAPGKVRCISLWQPWASLIAIGAKRIETRSWSTRYRGPLLIHAAKTMDGYEDIISHYEGDGAERIVKLVPPFGEVLKVAGIERLADLPRGALVCVAELVDCRTTDSLYPNINEQEREFGNFAPGRFGWILKNVRPLPKPIPLRGQQGMWDAEIDLEAALRDEAGSVRQEAAATQQHLF